VNAAQDVKTEMAELATQVGIFEDGAPDAERQQRRLLAFVRFFDERPDALVIFDNVEGWRILRNKAFGVRAGAAPPALPCRVLPQPSRRSGIGGRATAGPSLRGAGPRSCVQVGGANRCTPVYTPAMWQNCGRSIAMKSPRATRTVAWARS